MRKFILSSVFLLTALLLPAAVRLSDYVPGKTPGAKNLKFRAQNDVLIMDFGQGNGPKSRGWMRQYAPWMQQREQLAITIDVRASKVTDAAAQVYLLVQPLGENRRYLNGRSYAKYDSAGNYADKWKTLEFVFTMPDPARARNWAQGKVLMINFGAASNDGVFEFRNLQFKKKSAKTSAADSVISTARSKKLTEAFRKNPDYVYSVKFTGKKSSADEWSFELPPVEDFNGYLPSISFDFVMKNNNKSIQPQIFVNNRPLARLDHRYLPRLFNKKNPKDGGSGNYIYRLHKTLKLDGNNLITVKAGNGSDFTLKNVKLFYTSDLRPLYPDAPKPRKGAITILPGKTLRAALDGKVFLSEEFITGVPDIEKLPDSALRVEKTDGSIKTHNIVQLNDQTVDFRREARIMPNGELEIFMRTVYKKSDSIRDSYRLSLPAELFDGAEYEVRYGHRNKYNSTRGKVDFSFKNARRNIFYHAKNQKPVTHVHYLYLKKGDLKLVFDFSPLSVSGQINPYCQEPQKILNYVYKKGDKIIFDFGKRGNPEYYSFFVRIHAGEYDHFYRHGNTTTYYPAGPYLDNLGYHISFADRKGTARLNKSLYDFPWWQNIYQMPFQTAAVLQKGSELIFPGWISKPASGRSFRTGGKLPGSVGFFVKSGKGVYSVPLEPGIYMGSVTVGHTDKNIGPLNIKCNGEMVAENVTVKADHFRQIFFSVYVKSPLQQAILEFDGKNYAVNQLILRNTITEAEDYVWKNSFWRDKTLPEFALALDYTKASDGKAVPEPPNVMGRFVTDPIPQDGKFTGTEKGVFPEPPLPALNKDLKWAWNICLSYLGGGNNESGLSYRPDEKFREHCRNLKKAGFNWVMEQGLFWNLCYDEKTRQEHLKNLKALVKIMHEEGLKYIRHADGPSFNTIFRGAYATAEAAGWFPVDLGTLKNMQGAGCISNPYLRDHVIKILEKYVRETDCDMMMIDELYVLRTGGLCGCYFCRRKFFEDTGFTLPMPDDQAEFFKPGSRINAVWMDWKMRQDGDFFNEMKRRLTKIKPDLLLTSYGVDFQHPIGRFQTLAPYVDVLGIEGTTHYLFANYRHLLSARKMQAAFADAYGHSQWHIHHNDWGCGNLAMTRYLYRAFTSLNRSGVITQSGHPIIKNTNYNWPHWLDFRYQEPIADVGVFHRYDAYYRTDRPYLASEQFGISQLLSDRHIPHEFIIDLNKERLSKFKLVILGNASILSKSELAALEDFVRKGGKLLITGTFANYDEKFAPRTDKSYTAFTGVEYLTADLPGKAVYKYGSGSIKTHKAALKNLKGKVLLKLADGSPAVISNDYGRGQVITTPLTPGMAAFENIIIRGNPYVEVFTSEGAALLSELLAYTGHTDYPVKVRGANEKIIVESCRSSKTNIITIQLLNLNIPVKFVPGKVPPRVAKADLKFLPPAGDITVVLKNKVSSATAFSPDFEKARQLAVRHLPDGSSEITLPAELLKIYTMITVKE